MKFFSAACFATVLAVSAQAQKLNPAGVNGFPNTEFGYGSNTIVFGYPGVDDTIPESISAKIHKVTLDAMGKVEARKDNDFEYEYQITEKSKPSLLNIVLPEATKEDNYAIKYCKAGDQDCSDYSLATKVQDGTGHQLDCSEVNPAVEKFNMPEDGGLKGYADHAMMGKISTNGNSTMKTFGFNEMMPRQIMKVGKQWIAYFAFKLDLAGYKNLLKSTARNGYCARKYQLSILTHFLKKGNEGDKAMKIVKSLKFTPYLPQAKAAYLAETGPFEFELTGILGETDKPFGDAEAETNYVIWHTVCVTNKDTTSGAVKCAKPFRPDGDSVWNTKPFTILDNGKTDL